MWLLPILFPAPSFACSGYKLDCRFDQVQGGSRKPDMNRPEVGNLGSAERESAKLREQLDDLVLRTGREQNALLDISHLPGQILYVTVFHDLRLAVMYAGRQLTCL